MFQSSLTEGEASFSETDGGGVEEETEEAWRTVECADLKVTLRLLEGTRRFEDVKLPCDRRGVEAVVEYVQGVSRVGCSLQPRAAVRRVGAAPNIVKLGVVLKVEWRAWVGYRF